MILVWLIGIIGFLFFAREANKWFALGKVPEMPVWEPGDALWGVLAAAGVLMGCLVIYPLIKGVIQWLI